MDSRFALIEDMHPVAAQIMAVTRPESAGRIVATWPESAVRVTLGRTLP